MPTLIELTAAFFFGWSVAEMLWPYIPKALIDRYRQ